MYVWYLKYWVVMVCIQLCRQRSGEQSKRVVNQWTWLRSQCCWLLTDYKLLILDNRLQLLVYTTRASAALWCTLPRLTSCLCHLLAVWPEASYSTSLCFVFLICKTGITTVLLYTVLRGLNELIFVPRHNKCYIGIYLTHLWISFNFLRLSLLICKINMIGSVISQGVKWDYL